MKRIPLVPFPVEKALKFSRSFLWLADKLLKFFPALEGKLLQAEMEIRAREYLAMAIFSSLYWFTLLFSLLCFVGAAARVADALALAFSLGVLVAFVTFFYILFYPNLKVARRVREIDKNLFFAIRHLFIQVRSGVPLFDAMVSVARADYGVLSREFERTVKEISAGKDEIKALEDLALRNPSLFFRRVIWQIINSMKAGGDIGETLNVLTKSLSDEQRVRIRKYGSELAPLSLMYLMLTIILPTLGITFLIVFSSFTGLVIPEVLFYTILMVLGLFQFMFMGMIKSKRPSVEA